MNTDLKTVNRKRDSVLECGALEAGLRAEKKKHGWTGF
jgi:hypothetical protein